MGKRVITISREFGSGGRTIGKKTADRLGIPYYDKELIRKIAEETGFCQEFVEKQGEEASSSNWFFYSLTHGQAMGPNGMPMADYLWSVQYDIIRKLAEKEPCVIVGRCGDYVLEDREDCLHVFVHAPLEFKKERIIRLYGEREEKPEKRLEEKDKKRKLYYQHYTGRTWGMAQNYHLCLDSSLIGIDNCVDIIEKLAKGI